ncbi:type IX secretion system periplasmic lipoprotein PorW/SprE [Flavobacterium cerinum]|nr:tetratricopeptide repeat protein [Flavobacterium cerinum]
MKTSTYKYILLFGVAGFVVACSTKKDSFVNRNFHAVNTEYNVLYNGNVALDAGLVELTGTYQDDFWTILPVERMQPIEVKELGADSDFKIPVKAGAKDSKDSGKGSTPPPAAAPGKNANFTRAEEKATKAIQKHSMYIGSTERNPQIDEAHLLLGKSRYYENRFIPALEAFNYILLKYPGSDKIDDAKIWREKTNIRLDNEGIAIKNLRNLIKEKKDVMKEQTYADANAILAEAYLKTEVNDSVVYLLREAAKFTRDNEQKARYHFILGQLYSKLKQPDSAFVEYQRVIDMKRKSPRRYVIQAHAMQAGQFNHAGGDTLAFMENYRKLLKDRENRPYLDIINHQVGLFYDKQNDKKQAVTYYNKSLRSNSKDRYLTASNHRNIAEINFKNAKYPVAGTYYDSTMVFLDKRSREFKNIKKKRDNLVDVIKYEAIAQTNDSILHIVSLDEAGRTAFFEDYIIKLKEQEERERKRLEAEAIRQENLANSGSSGTENPLSMMAVGNTQLQDKAGLASAKSVSKVPFDNSANNANQVPGGATGGMPGAGGKFYFYTPSTVSYGKLEFKKRWGGRALSENWRWSSEQKNKAREEDTQQDGDNAVAGKDGTSKPKEEKSADPRYTADFYLKQLPTSKVVIDSLTKERNFAYYQLGSIYKDKFKEYQLAADKLERLLQNNPEERLVLPSKYNLYKIYEIIDPSKADKYKQQILSQYPDSRYAEIIRNPTSKDAKAQTPDAAYAALFKKYESGQIREVYVQVDEDIDTYTGESIVSKFELLKTKISARLFGIEEYKKGLNFVALNYPNSEEGKEAELILKTDIPSLEKLAFGQPTASWKIVFKFDSADDPKIKPLTEKIQKFIKDGLNNSITLSNDIYTLKENMLVIHGLISKLAAEDAVSVLKDYKTYKITETPVIISSEDYKVVQIKKNFTEFLAIE